MKQQASLHLLIVLSRAYKTLMDFIKKDIQKHQLNTTEFAVMELLYHKGAQPIQKIGSRTLLASGSVTYVLDQLVKKGWIVRRPCTTDRRVTYAELTPAGQTLIARIFPQHAEAIDQALDALGEEEKEILIQLLKKTGLSIQSKGKG